MVDIMLVEVIGFELVGAALQPEPVDGNEGQEKALAAAVRAVAAHRRFGNVALDRVGHRAAVAAASIRHVLSPAPWSQAIPPIKVGRVTCRERWWQYV